MTLSSRERIRATMNHEEPDRVPVDLGGCNASNIMVGPYRRLCEHLGIDVEPIYVANVREQTVIIDDRMADALGLDAKEIDLFPERWVEGRAYDGTPILLPQGFVTEELEDGGRLFRDSRGNPELKLPKGGFFFDIIRHPLGDVASVADIDAFMDRIEGNDRPSWADLPLDRLAAKVDKVGQRTGRFLVGSFLGRIFQAAQTLRGFSNFMIDLIKRPALAEALLDRLAQAHIEAFDRYAETVGKSVDIILICDDLGMQQATWMSPETYRRQIKPYQARLYGHIKKKCDAPILLHSDGSLYPLIPDLIEIGVDALNPVQYTAKDMDLARLKREFGDDLCFWGGGVDTQHTLPFATAEEVAEEVKRNIDILAPGGGFVFAAVHNVVEGVPTENILATFRTAKEHGVY